MEFIKKVAQVLWKIILSIAQSINRLFQWWLNKIKTSGSRKGQIVWLVGGLMVACFAWSFLYTITPAGRRSIIEGQATQTAVAIAGATSQTETRNAPTNTPIPTDTPFPTSTPRPIDTPKPQPTGTPLPVATPLDVQFGRKNTGAFDWFDFHLRGQILRVSFDLEGDNAGGSECEALGEGLIFRKSIPLQFGLVISQPNGEIVFSDESIDTPQKGYGYTCSLEIQNETGLSERDEFEGYSFSISIYHRVDLLDQILLVVSDSQLELK